MTTDGIVTRTLGRLWLWPVKTLHRWAREAWAEHAKRGEVCPAWLWQLAMWTNPLTADSKNPKEGW